MQKKRNIFFSIVILAFMTWIVTLATVYADGPVLPGSQGTTSASGQAAAPATGTQGAPAPSSPFGTMLPLLVMFGVVYFLMIRPQQKRSKDQQKMISTLADGDEVVTSSGILGRIAGTADKVVTLEIANNVKIKVLKSQIAQVVKGPIKDLN
jgi:preprotein translocase subunit YajC